MFMVLVVLKNGGTWEMLSNIFHVKTATFIKTTTSFIRVIAPRIYDDWVNEKAQEENMRMLVTSGRTPTGPGNMAEALPYYSAKHKLYGYKVEVSVGPRGFALNCTGHARGNTYDITIFRRNEAFHHTTRRKTDEDRTLRDTGILSAEYPDEWAVLADKGCQGLEQHMRCIHPTKGSNLSAAVVQQNADISSDRIIVENWFGRMCGLWRICADKYRWAEDRYDDIFQTCAALTNMHIGYYPLRAANGEEYNQRQNRLIVIGREKEKKRHASLKNVTESVGASGSECRWMTVPIARAQEKTTI
ncbi:hypothetical protein PC118_g24117 [Phytophthora cactorum]|uniref:DDE Tnp4 domain-containing protein n=2 Tax=Phytophthora cactorum TaxID=29920 RepID=A0A8T1A9X9_9STRA|nr:hypothetical protein PC115_g24002 [Phytophthora cactorum]KAG2879329.1 hypothetical protein PC117_g26783 [Phytophthora cactorum]KAG2957239.1 hypothetical protein PC118_g24117 [Phytophthora cactorum]KAG3047315.1 hypothetical protein PC122_g24142 [Phytophthora cactorum]KAG3123153.1 hypothetical protein C6341_g26664 [Phytophthora cactorum]